jgi:N-acetylneuraminate synthase
MTQFDFNGLFILDMANNHQGDLDHGLNIISAMGSVVQKTGVRAAIKFQFRQLDTFIHPDFLENGSVPHIPRFLSTRLSTDNYEKLIIAVREQNMVPMCTPFDEESVALIEGLDIDVIKIASCSGTDIPLLERVAAARMPTIASTGGMSIEEIDRMVQIFDNHDLNYALHHCVSIYPTPRKDLQLNQIEFLERRYSPTSIGWSTHEDPDDEIPIQLAFAKGARFFERHVGIETIEYKLNRYSSSPDQIEKWIVGYRQAVEACGAVHRSPSPPEEIDALKSLMRGIYVRNPIKKGAIIKRTDVYFAMPAVEGVLFSGQWHDSLVADKDYSVNDSLSQNLADHELTESEIINTIMLQVRGMLRDARIHLAKTSKIEISHHYGLKRFREFGAVIIDVINREYCKKLIVQLPRQKHPYHYHKKKEETFQILYGYLEVTINGDKCLLSPGDTFLVEPNRWHKFSTMGGVVFEEVSTTHYNDDSFYQDERISRQPRDSRKTIVPNWEL